MKKIVLVLFGLLIHFTILAQQKSDKIAPAWMNGDMPTQMNNSYWFKVTYGEGKTLSEARHNATLSLLGDLIKSKGITVSGNEVEKILSINTNDAYAETVKREHSYNIEFAENKFSFFAADEYWTKSKEEYICYVLFEIANNPQSVNFDKINFTTNYGASAFLRSCIVPGWGQMYKKQKAKGIAILSTEIIGISGIIVSQNIHKSYKNKANRESSNELRTSYMNKSNNWGNIRNGFIIGSAALYVYNLVDALTSKGARRYISPNLAINPVVDIDNATGLSLSYKF